MRAGPFRLLLPAALALAGATCSTAPEPFVTGDALVLLSATLIDGTGASAVHDAALVIRDSVVVFAGRRADVTISPEARVADLGAATILPGFVDAHVHGAYSAANLQTWAAAGVTTVRDEGIFGGAVLSDLVARRDAEWSDPVYARLIIAGRIITAPGGYGAIGVPTADSAQRVVNAELDQGADLVKVAVEDGTGSQTGLPVLSTEALGAAVAAAHARGRRISAHVTDGRFLQTVVDAGVDDVAHSTWDTPPDAALRRMAERQITLVPTLTVFEPFGALVVSQANLRHFMAMGGLVALGDDYGGLAASLDPHFALGMPMPEIRWMRAAGMTPMQVIVAATRNAARAVGLASVVGTLTPGRQADVLVVDGDPLADLEALLAVRLVIHRGVAIRGVLPAARRGR